MRAAEATLNAVLEAEIVTLDPHFTGAYISRTFGYMVYDTLFAPDSKGVMKVIPDGATAAAALQ